jgi:hypothetical protein
VEHASGDRGGALQRIDGLHAVVDHQLDLARVVAVREDSNVAPAQNRDPGIECRLEARALASNRRRFGAVSLLPPRVLRYRIAGGQRRAERDVVFLHQGEHFWRSGIAVLDRLDSRQHRAAHPLGGGGVRDDRPSAALGRSDDSFQFVDREGRGRFAVRAPAVVCIDFDPIRPMTDLIADDADQRVAVGLFGPLRNPPFGRETLRSIAPGRDNCAGRHQHAGPWNDPLFDCLLQFSVGVGRPFGPQVANRGKAGRQRRAKMIRGPRHPKRETFVQHLIVPRRLVVGMQKNMGMTFDQSRQKRGAGHVDRRGGR